MRLASSAILNLISIERSRGWLQGLFEELSVLALVALFGGIKQ